MITQKAKTGIILNMIDVINKQGNVNLVYELVLLGSGISVDNLHFFMKTLLEY